MSYLTITDLFGNNIKITNVDEAMMQARSGIKVDFCTSPFEVVNGHSQVIKGRESETVFLSAYWQDVLTKLKAIKAQIIWDEFITPINNKDEFSISIADL